jgi:hypothetical protein
MSTDQILEEWVSKEKFIYRILSVPIFCLGAYLVFAIPAMQARRISTSISNLLPPTSSPLDSIISLLPFAAFGGAIYCLWFAQQDERIREQLLKIKPDDTRLAGKLFLGLGLFNLVMAIIARNPELPLLPFFVSFIFLVNYPINRWRAEQAEKL